jgi:hypothetical protein
MAEVVSEFPGNGRVARDESKYAKYLDGQAWKLKIGVDCSKNGLSSASYLHSVAKRRGLLIKTSIIGDSLYIQAQKKDS